MDLWIRSQSRTLLEKANSIKIAHYTENQKVLNSIVVNNDYVFGEYETQERALEVLEEIQGKITQNECLKTMIPKVTDIRGYEEMYGNLFKKMVYEMPLE